MRKLLVSASLALALVLGACTSTTVTTGFYTVSGTSGKQLDREVRRKGPLKGHAFAATEIRMTPDVEEEVLPGGCRIKRAKIKVAAHITLPKWNDRASADKDLRRGWDNLAAYAKWHEDQHVKIAETWAREMERALLGMPAEPTCSALARKAGTLVKGLAKRHNAAQLAFDAAETKRIRKIIREAERQAKS